MAVAARRASPGDPAAKLHSHCSPSATAERSDRAGTGGQRGQSPQPHVSEQKRQGPALQSSSLGCGGHRQPPSTGRGSRGPEDVPPGAGEAAQLPVPSPRAIGSLQSHGQHRWVVQESLPARLGPSLSSALAQHKLGMQSRKALGFGLWLGNGGRGQTEDVHPPPSQH